MAKNHKLRAVVRHEYLTIIKQPSFWISLIFVPALIGIIMLIGVLTDSPKNIDPIKGKTYRCGHRRKWADQPKYY
jgi:ABC-type Na+ efflux pump permease subunit